MMPIRSFVVFVACLLPVASLAHELRYFSGDLAPEVGVLAGHFDGTLLYGDDYGTTRASWMGATATATFSNGIGAIELDGTVESVYGGQGASALVFVPFMLYGWGNTPYSFIAMSDADSDATGNFGIFNQAEALLGIFNTQTYLHGGLIYLDRLLPASGVISNEMLGDGDAFFVIGFATEAKPAYLISSPPYEANFSANFVLNPSPVPEPATVWLLICGALSMFAVLRRRQV